MRNMIPYIFIILGIISTVVGFILLKNTRAVREHRLSVIRPDAHVIPSYTSGRATIRLEEKKLLNERVNDHNRSLLETAAKTLAKFDVNSDDTLSKKVSKDNSKEKGDAFEGYAVSKFKTNFFKLLEWQGDKYHNGIYPESNQNPDLLYGLQGQADKFAVECKWRSGFINGKVEWTNDQQLKRYNQYMLEKNLPVFIVLGIGGEPSRPDEVYAIPLRRMKYSFATKDYLQQFKRLDASRNFYYDLKGMSLR
jgi:hypothetical protein